MQPLDVFQKLHALLECRFSTKIQSYNMDGSGEFKSLQSYLKTHCIEHLVSHLYTLQWVSLVERRHRHVIETTWTFLHQASLASQFWSFACQQVVYFINRLTTPNFCIRVHLKFYFKRRQSMIPLKYLAASVIHGSNYMQKIN